MMPVIEEVYVYAQQSARAWFGTAPQGLQPNQIARPPSLSVGGGSTYQTGLPEAAANESRSPTSGNIPTSLILRLARLLRLPGIGSVVRPEDIQGLFRESLDRVDYNIDPDTNESYQEFKPPTGQVVREEVIITATAPNPNKLVIYAVPNPEPIPEPTPRPVPARPFEFPTEDPANDPEYYPDDPELPPVIIPIPEPPPKPSEEPDERPSREPDPIRTPVPRPHVPDPVPEPAPAWPEPDTAPGRYPRPRPDETTPERAPIPETAPAEDPFAPHPEPPYDPTPWPAPEAEPGIPPGRITVRPGFPGLIIEIEQKPSPEPDPWPKESRTRRNDEKDSRLYRIVLKFVNMTFGTLTEIDDFMQVFFMNVWVDEKTRLSQLSLKKRIKFLNDLGDGKIDLRDYRIDWEQMILDFVVMQAQDYVIGKISGGAAESLRKAGYGGGLPDPLKAPGEL